MKHLEAAIEIQAPPEDVWRILVNFAHYPAWNPFIISMEGQAAVGEILQEVVRQPDGKQIRLSSKIFALEENRYLAWDGYLGAPFLFSGRHELILEPLPHGTRLIQREAFSGLMLFMMNLKAIEPGYHQMNQALKAQAEGA